MQGKDIKVVFEKAGVVIPSNIDIFGYDDDEGWCCGYEAKISKTGDVLFKKYCHRGRSQDKLYIYKKNGECAQLRTPKHQVRFSDCTQQYLWLKAGLPSDWQAWCDEADYAARLMRKNPNRFIDYCLYKIKRS